MKTYSRKQYDEQQEFEKAKKQHSDYRKMRKNASKRYDWNKE